MAHIRNDRGDTLIEVIFALVILSMVLITVMSIGRLGRVQSTNASDRTKAINMVQEQYEAIRAYRDGNVWADFTGGNCLIVGCSGVQVVTNSCNGNLCLHMERDARPTLVGLGNNPNYGKWVTCPGPWNPPLDYDTTWNSSPTAAELLPGSNYSRFGCRGSAVGGGQSNITVWIEIDNPAVQPVCSSTSNVYRIIARGSWKEAGGLQANSTTAISSYLSNLKGQPTGCI